MLALHVAVRPTLVRAISLFVLVAVVLAYHPVSAARPGPFNTSHYEPAPSAALVVNVVGGSALIPDPVDGALVTIHDAGSGNKAVIGYTNRDAKIDFKLAPGAYMVAIEAESHGSFMSEPFTLEANESLSLMIMMSPAP